MHLRNWRDAARATGLGPLQIAQAVLDGKIPRPKRLIVWTEAEFQEAVSTLKRKADE